MNQVVTKNSELQLYLKTSVAGAIVFVACVAYLKFLAIPGEINKAAADTSVILMGFSMLLSSICYFWNKFDWMIVYRKYLGLVGFAFGIAHLVMSRAALPAFFTLQTWQQGKAGPVATGLFAFVIFTIMAVVSNSFMAAKIGGRNWRYVLRSGYLAMLLVWFHVVLLKSGRWVTWFQGGMKTLPSLSLLVTMFIVVVIGMRLVLWRTIVVKKKNALKAIRNKSLRS